MSIVLPFNRIGVSASGHASRAARSSSWLNRPRDVRRDVEALFKALEAPRSPDTATVATSAAADVDSHAGGSHASTSRHPHQFAHRNAGTVKSPWKGKGRALPVDEDAVAQRLSRNEYVEEGYIRRPVSSFFNANAQRTKIEDVMSEAAPAASASVAVAKQASRKRAKVRLSKREIHKIAAVNSFRKRHQLPETESAAKLLVNRIASSPLPLESLNILLELMPEECSPQVEIAALTDCLAFPVMPHADWNLKSLDKARSQAYNKGWLGPRIVIDDVTFYKVWMRLCDLAGENVKVSSEVATRTLKHILTLPSPKKLMLKPEPYRVGKALRQLLFLAGLEDNPTLAVNILAQTIHINIFCSENLLAAAQLDPGQAASLQTAVPAAEVNDIVLILQDLLRSGIFSPSLVNRFGLSEVISKAPTLSSEAFGALLKQTLLRIILQYYVDHGEQRYIPNIASVIKSIDTTNSKEAVASQESDLTLLLDAAKTSLTHLRYDPRHAASVARCIARLLQALPDSMPQTQSNNDEPSTPLGDVRRVVNDYFQIVLDPATEEIEEAAIATDLSRLWRTLSDTRALNVELLPSITILQQARLLKILSLSKDDELEALLLDAARHLAKRAQLAVDRGTKLGNHVANSVLHGVVHLGRHLHTKQAEHFDVLGQIYDLFRRQDSVLGGFSLQSQTLRPLIQFLQQVTPSTAEEAGDSTVSSSFVIGHFMRTRSAWKVVPHADYTALAGALLDNGEPDAARQVLKQIFDAKEVPSLEDVEICLKILARKHPLQARKIIDNAQKEGLLVEPQI
ncbi:hypothetical protein P389DRAFT_166556 [Cystobasidium minutum MCA 4210]|uniref:uncharacterized protein n=1 Tax=Cystobasidium minutum MCA 4210 TaxID=1397322 RepID=UPI0034CECD73|eukprot:jgi/Rhomi1/166556/fgenesh1_kg.2_\